MSSAEPPRERVTSSEEDAHGAHPFFDNLAMIPVLLLLAVVVRAYGGVLAGWAARRDDPQAMRSIR